MTTTWMVRALTSAERELLATATLGNLNWSAERFTSQDVEARPRFHNYTVLKPERGDFGIVAEAAGEPIGVVWAQYLGASDPGYGFVDEATPEISLWVSPSRRGQGVGRHLLRALQAETRRRRIAHLSLSVEHGNFAARLYAAEGFVPVEGREEDGVMVWASPDGPTDPTPLQP